MADKFEVVNEGVTEMMRGIGERIHGAIADAGMGGKMGFALFIFDFGEAGATFYMADAQRDDMLRLLEEFIERQRKEQG